MSLMNARSCSQALLDTHRPLAYKARVLSDYLQWHSTFGSRMGVGARMGRAIALNDLFNALPGTGSDEHQRLKAVLDEIHKYGIGQRASAKKQASALRTQLQSLAPGTPIHVKAPRFRSPVAFLEVRRTRFVFEDSDGRRFEASVHAFDRIAEDGQASVMPDDERERRELVRALAGGSFPEVRAQILADGMETLDALLTELDAAFRRVENAPVGMSKGLLTSSLGPGRLVSPRDQALLTRIPRVISELAKQVGVAKVRRRLRSSKNIEVIEAVEAILKRIEQARPNLTTSVEGAVDNDDDHLAG